MRAIAICALVAGCGRPEAAASAPEAEGPVRGAPSGAPGPSKPSGRLGDAAAPISYDLTLELDPDRATFAGHVAIAIAVTASATRTLWLHAAELEIARATLTIGGRVEPVTVLAGDPALQLRGFALPRAIDPGTVVLTIDYTGQVSDQSRRYGKDEEGLFRERTGGRWYLYSQAESVFARKIVPCFDEPRWKPAWRVTAIVPRGQVALGNAPSLTERALPGGRREVRFAEIAALPSYLIAVAVGPFELVDAGAVGRRGIPARIAVAAGDGVRVGRALRELPRIVDALEAYVDAPLPVAKLDLVAVPQFFGAMENPGLITYEHGVLVGGHDLVVVTAHELAHQWFGNAVTPVWWEHLWLSEAFASWLGEQIAQSLGAAPPPEIAHRGRADALAADDLPGARPLLHPIASSAEVEPMFDALAYDKGAAMLAMFERFAGPDRFRAAVRGYVAAHAGRAVTSQAWFDALAGAASPAISAALAANLRHAGTPVVELERRCGARPAIVAMVRGGDPLPVCVRYPSSPSSSSSSPSSSSSSLPGAAAATRVCFLAGAHTEQPLPAAAGCPAWIVGNDGGRGYYRTVWRGAEPTPPFAQLSPDEQLARGDDLALAVRHGDRSLGDALADLTALAATRDPYGALAA
ncbi:MAG TPA: M1 family metallopeptidase, partial [Kofleriaceae bacterium]|nr:M1 family metallopeptidase [Kofleriaceae bacterium]